MSGSNYFYHNLLVKAKVGHNTSKGVVTEIDADGRISTDSYSGTFTASALELVTDSKDIVEHQEIVHIDAQVTKALMTGHIVRVGDEEYRFAYKNQKLYENDSENKYYVATDSGVFSRMMDYDGADFDTPSGFRWVLFSDKFSIMDFLLERMTKDEKMAAIMNLSFDNAINDRG